METLKKEVLIGLIIGIFSNVSGSYLYIYFFSTFNLEDTINKAIETGVIGNIIALGAILNLFVFFIQRPGTTCKMHSYSLKMLDEYGIAERSGTRVTHPPRSRDPATQVRRK